MLIKMLLINPLDPIKLLKICINIVLEELPNIIKQLFLLLFSLLVVIKAELALEVVLFVLLIALNYEDILAEWTFDTFKATVLIADLVFVVH